MGEVFGRIKGNTISRILLSNNIKFSEAKKIMYLNTNNFFSGFGHECWKFY